MPFSDRDANMTNRKRRTVQHRRGGAAASIVSGNSSAYQRTASSSVFEALISDNPAAAPDIYAETPSFPADVVGREQESGDYVEAVHQQS